MQMPHVRLLIQFFKLGIRFCIFEKKDERSVGGVNQQEK